MPVESLEEAVTSLEDRNTEQIFDSKVQVALDEAIGSQQIHKIAKVDVMKDHEYVQKLGAELLHNEKVLSDLNFAVTWYTQDRSAKVLDEIQSIVSQGSPNYSDNVVSIIKNGHREWSSHCITTL